MLLSVIAAVLMLAEAPVAAAPAATPPAATQAAPAPAPVDPVIQQLDTLMAAWKGKSGDPLRGRLGLSHSSRTASDGDAVYWISRQESMGCGIDASGAMRCGSGGARECVLAVGFDKQGLVKAWKVQGAPEACQTFVDALAKP